MSVTIETIVSCDGDSPDCEGHDWSADSRSHTAAEQRQMAKEQMGWRFHKGKDYCPTCWQFKKEKQPTPARRSRGMAFEV